MLIFLDHAVQGGIFIADPICSVVISVLIAMSVAPLLREVNQRFSTALAHHCVT